MGLIGRMFNLFESQFNFWTNYIEIQFWTYGLYNRSLCIYAESYLTDFYILKNIVFFKKFYLKQCDNICEPGFTSGHPDSCADLFGG